MKWSKVRLIVAATLFTGWIGYLAFLSSKPKQQIVISRAALADADIVVKIEVGTTPVADTPKFVCLGIVGDAEGSPKVGDELRIVGIAAVTAPDRKPLGAGVWLLPVRRNGGNVVEAVATGTFPSYKSSFGPVAYPANREIEAELHRLLEARSARTR